MYVDNDLLVLHMNSYIRKYAVGQDGQLIQRSEVRKQVATNYHNSQPVVDKTRGLYFITQNGNCYSYNLETGVQVPTS